MKKKVLALLCALVISLLLPLTASANGLGSPTLTVLVNCPPSGLTLSLEFQTPDSRSVEMRSSVLSWEGAYRFYGSWPYDGEQLATAQLVVSSEQETFSIPVDAAGFSQWDNLLTLDLSTRTLIPGQPWWRQPLLVALRVLFTLLLEGLVFFLYGYRRKRSWAVFLTVNLITQLAVNLVVQSLAALSDSYMALVNGMCLYTPLEIAVLLVEMAVFALLLKERRRRRAVGCAVVANLSSWALGGFLLMALPL